MSEGMLIALSGSRMLHMARDVNLEFGGVEEVGWA